MSSAASPSATSALRRGRPDLRAHQPRVLRLNSSPPCTATTATATSSRSACCSAPATSSCARPTSASATPSRRSGGVERRADGPVSLRAAARRRRGGRPARRSRCSTAAPVLHGGARVTPAPRVHPPGPAWLADRHHARRGQSVASDRSPRRRRGIASDRIADLRTRLASCVLGSRARRARTGVCTRRKPDPAQAGNAMAAPARTRTMGRVALLATYATEQALAMAGLATTTRRCTRARPAWPTARTSGSCEALADFCATLFTNMNAGCRARLLEVHGPHLRGSLSQFFGVRGRIWY